MTSRAKWLWAAGVVLAAGSAVTLAAGAVFCSATLHVPRTPVPKLAPAGARTVSLRARDGVRLEAWHFAAPNHDGRCVILLHGIADRRGAGFAPLFLEAGYSVLAPDSRAHGESGGADVTYGLLEKHDLLDWAAWSRSQGCVAIYALGESLGAAVTIQPAEIEPAFRAIVAECSFSDLETIGEYRLRASFGVPPPLDAWVVHAGMIWARVRYGFDFRNVSPRTAIAHTRTPILLIHGLADRQTPPAHSEALARANPSAELWLVPGAGHTEAAQAAGPEFARRVLAWFARH